MSEAIEWLLTWSHAPYLFSLLVFGLFMLVQLVFGFSDAINIDSDGDVDVDLDADGDVEFGGWSMSAILGFIGYKKAPVPVLFMSVTMLFGVLGLIASAGLKVFIGLPVLGSALQTGITLGAFLMALIVTGRLASLINRVLPADTSTTRPESSREGEIAIAASTISERAGQIEMEGRWVDAVVAKGRKSIPKGSQVIIIQHDHEHHNYIVEPLA